MTSALASLTATYTDSEGEEDENDEVNEDTKSVETTTKSPTSSTPENKTPHSSQPPSPTTIRVTTKVTKLVSYHDDTVASDDYDDESEEVPHQVILMTENEQGEGEMGKYDGITIPPDPPGHCSQELQEKITKLYEKMQTQQLDMNAMIQKRKDFRNPSIYEKLIQYCDLDELGTNYPPAIYDPLKWSKDSYYEELARVQKTEMDKLEKERKSKIEFLTGTKKHDDEKKRKSKWDQPGMSSGSVKPAGLVQPSLTTSATGTKGTVISAFGSLPKKPRL